MSDLNKVMLIGHLGKDPESRALNSGGIAVNMSLATTEKWKDKNTGDAREQTEWHRITVFGSLAKVCMDWLKKGSHIYIEGQIRTRKWKDKEGQDRYTTEINAHNMSMLGGTKTRDEQRAGGSSKPSGPTPGPETGTAGGKDGFEEDIPF
jgi:single-strand DNA-binding protein